MNVKSSFSLPVAAALLVLSCNSRDNQAGEGVVGGGQMDSVRTIDSRRNTLGVKDPIYDTANRGTDSTSNTGGTPSFP